MQVQSLGREDLLEEGWVGKISWRRAWQPTPVFLPGESHGQRSLAIYSPWDCKESDMTEQLSVSLETREYLVNGALEIRPFFPHFLPLFLFLLLLLFSFPSDTRKKSKLLLRKAADTPNISRRAKECCLSLPVVPCPHSEPTT